MTDAPEPRRGGSELRETIRSFGLELGFTRVGFAAAAEPPGTRERILEWLARGHHASMAWMERDPSRRWEPERILPGAKSVIVVSMIYRTDAPVPVRPGLPRISRYAHGRDYHEVLGERLHALTAELERLAPGTRTRVACDTSPIADKAFAREGGIGWIGKNSCLIHPEDGSFTFLGEVSRPRPSSDPAIRDHCGSCTRCLDACPTDAASGAVRRREPLHRLLEHRASRRVRAGLGGADRGLAGRL
ncbi:MAG: DUF1730 domain-containing protein [Candidatus Eisenbacteria bacterium]